jgi:HAD superfamily hydrolase (TIGR01549 family)
MMRILRAFATVMNMNIFSSIKALFFDVSDTLYTNEALEKEYPRVLTQLVADTKNISFDEAKQRIKETTESLQATEKHVTKVRAVRALGLSREQAQQAIATIRPQDFLSPDQALAVLVQTLGQHYKLGIISNLRKAHLLDVLGALGLSENLFPYLITEDIVELTKPHPEPFLKAIELAGLKPEECVFVGDSPTKDMRPAKELGMMTILVKANPTEEDLLHADASITGIAELTTLL